MLEIYAMIKSLNAVDKVKIIHYKDNNDAVAEYNGKRYGAIFNAFTELFYVDDVHSELEDQASSYLTRK